MRFALKLAPAILALCLWAAPGSAQNPGSFGGAPVSNSSGNVVAAPAVATIPAIVGRTAYVCALQMTGGGATAASIVTATLAGILGGTATFVYPVVAGVALGNPPIILPFPVCIPASAQNVAIVLTLPSLGAGNTNAAVSLFGYYGP